jgi:hypothetical protein
MRRILQIAFSTLSGVLCALTVALWANSHSQFRAVWISSLEIDSVAGRLVIYATAKNPASVRLFVQPHVASVNHNLPRPFSSRAGSFFVCVPHWFVAQLLGLLAIAPWISWRQFSIKRLLLATTYLAVLLGLIILSQR